jgi:hypothetical protein
MEEGTERIFWIDLILVFNLKIVSVQKFHRYSLETISSEKCIQMFKEFIYNGKQRYTLIVFVYELTYCIYSSMNKHVLNSQLSHHYVGVPYQKNICRVRKAHFSPTCLI